MLRQQIRARGFEVALGVATRDNPKAEKRRQAGCSQAPAARLAEPTKARTDAAVQGINLVQYMVENGPGEWCRSCDAHDTLYR
jgi:hypothetical protein